MTAQEFASLLRARSVGRGKWTACCPAHGDRHASLSIAEGKKQPVVFRCMSQGCSQEEVLAAIGLSWKDLMGERPAMTPELRGRLRDERALREWREIDGLIFGLAVFGVLSYKDQHIRQLHDKVQQQRRILEVKLLNAELRAIRERDTKTLRFVNRWGWDKLISLFDASDQGKRVIAEFGRQA